MSRSYKKTNVCGNTTAASDKPFKKIWHSKMRTIERDKLKDIEKVSVQNADEIEHITTVVNDVSSTYDTNKDGKHFFDQEKRPELMRK